MVYFQGWGGGAFIPIHNPSDPFRGITRRLATLPRSRDLELYRALDDWISLKFQAQGLGFRGQGLKSGSRA